MKHKAFGLDIGTTTVKLVWLESNKETYSLLSSATAQTTSKGLFSESPIDHDEAADMLKKLISEAKIGTPYVNIALPERNVYTKVIEMPLLSDKELSAAIHYEAEQYIPVPLSTITLDWRVLRRTEKNEANQKMDVLLVGAPTKLIERYQKILTKAGLIIFALETEILSAIRALMFTPDKNARIPTSLILHIGALNTSLAIVRDDAVAFTFSIPTGGTAINRAIAADFGFSLAQAEEYKKVYGMSKDSIGGKIGQATTPILMSLVLEVKKAMTYYNERNNNESPIQQIILSGATAKLFGIDLFFAQHCGVQAAIANPWNGVSTRELPKEVLDNAPEYTIAVGLAMRNYE